MESKYVIKLTSGGTGYLERKINAMFVFYTSGIFLIAILIASLLYGNSDDL